MERKIHVYPTKADVVRAVAEMTVATVADAVKAAGKCSLVLSGGSTPKDLYALLATDEYRARIPWERVHLFWGDERTVPPDHKDSNFGMTKSALLDHVSVPAENVHRIRGEAKPEAAASEYRATIRRYFDGGPPRFDLVYLGMGPDGHTASLFPGSTALDERTETAVANFAPGPNTWRITLTFPVINAACKVVFLVTGKDKTTMAARVLGAKEPMKELPSTLVRPEAGELHWLLDEDAAGEIRAP